MRSVVRNCKSSFPLKMWSSKDGGCHDHFRMKIVPEMVPGTGDLCSSFSNQIDSCSWMWFLNSFLFNLLIFPHFRKSMLCLVGGKHGKSDSAFDKITEQTSISYLSFERLSRISTLDFWHKQRHSEECFLAVSLCCCIFQSYRQLYSLGRNKKSNCSVFRFHQTWFPLKI